ncbi:hypothetical protein M2650_00115 [Luteimonas sp. SX5]|uniref:Uncharacterized protein n=1 Tax=Luteimonas galliterrae TaxID=2940486 RepID=A0ABT0MFD6_9GAMM|nr:hypothetical protein [Luteimonas galliterrae]MCL1633055.1 hypothetical protein [Luteimonas galliterrae]
MLITVQHFQNRFGWPTQKGQAFPLGHFIVTHDLFGFEASQAFLPNLSRSSESASDAGCSAIADISASFAAAAIEIPQHDTQTSTKNIKSGRFMLPSPLAGNSLNYRRRPVRKETKQLRASLRLLACRNGETIDKSSLNILQSACYEIGA